jgi:Ca2+-binding EF-hand superfamily protein
LCGGSRDDKVKAAFDLFDENGDGFISEDEMVKYLSSVFTILYESSPETKASSGVSAVELAIVTTRQCFEDADVNHDGRLSFEEFKRWYSQSQGGDEPATSGSGGMGASFDEVCRLTNLRSYTVEDVSRLLFQGSRSGALDRSTFIRAFRLLRENMAMSSAEDAQTDAIVAQLFELFDEDGNGYVDHAEMASGLSVLCGGSREDRVRAAFSLYDTDGNGFISLDEMTRYLRSVYRLLYTMKPEIAEKMEDVGPDELAQVTSQQAFAEADVDHDGQLSFEEFQRWYSRPGSLFG